MAMQPIVLPANQPANRFYRGGSRISAFRSAPPCGEYEPEDWIASTTCCHGQDTIGLTKLPNGALLRDEIKNNPQQWLGPDHVKKFGTDTKMLLKFLDAGQRLPVHAHPHRDWARHHLGAPCGKAELWYVLEPGVMRIGLRESVTAERLRTMVAEQDVETLISMMHEVSLKRNQAVYVPPGVLHAIGEGMLIVEVQEPSDLSVFCEWRDYPLDGVTNGHLGLGFDVALTAVEISGRSKQEIKDLVMDAEMDGPVGERHTEEYFRVERHTVTSKSEFTPGFAVIIVLDIEALLEIKAAGDDTVPLRKGTTVVVPYGAGAFCLRGERRRAHCQTAAGVISYAQLSRVRHR